jgi:methylthioxylose transferase
MSKGETERIWLPFTLWIVAIPALLPPEWRRPLLLSQVAIAVLAQTLLITKW